MSEIDELRARVDQLALDLRNEVHRHRATRFALGVLSVYLERVVPPEDPTFFEGLEDIISKVDGKQEDMFVAELRRVLAHAKVGLSGGRDRWPSQG